MEAGPIFEKVEKIKMPIRIVILIGTIVLLGGLFVWFYYLPQKAEIEKTEKQIASLNQELTRARIKAKNYDKFKKEFEEVFGVKVDGINTFIKGNKKIAYVKLAKENPAIDVATKFGMI